jgi:hypothetical protein
MDRQLEDYADFGPQPRCPGWLPWVLVLFMLFAFVESDLALRVGVGWPADAGYYDNGIGGGECLGSNW